VNSTATETARTEFHVVVASQRRSLSVLARRRREIKSAQRFTGFSSNARPARVAHQLAAGAKTHFVALR
jgi:hypothetical protein